jgi:hypothetical protein
MKGQFSRSYDHKPSHYKFPRTYDGYLSETESNGDWLVGGVALAIVFGLLVYSLIYWVIQ